VQNNLQKQPPSSLYSKPPQAYGFSFWLFTAASLLWINSTSRLRKLANSSQQTADLFLIQILYSKPLQAYLKHTILLKLCEYVIASVLAHFYFVIYIQYTRVWLYVFYTRGMMTPIYTLKRYQYNKKRYNTSFFDIMSFKYLCNSIYTNNNNLFLTCYKTTKHKCFQYTQI
jgi:hypothetical protein